MMFLRQRLEAWRAAGLIDATQVEKIVAHEDSSRASARWLIWAVAALGGLAIAAGIISVIAANWDDIPDTLKLGAAVLALSSLPLAAYRLGDRADNWPRDLVLFVHQLLVLGVIGVVAQVFHLHGQAWRPFAMATFLAAPVAVAATRALHVNVLIALAMTTAGLGLDQLGAWEVLWEGSLPGFAVAGALGAVLYSGSVLADARRWERVAEPLRLWGKGLAFFALVCQSVRWVTGPCRPGSDQIITFIALPIGAVCLAAAFRRITPARVIGLLSAVALLLGPDVAFADESVVTKIIGFVLSSVVCLAWAFVAADLGRRRQVSFATFLLGLRIVLAFFDLFESLMDTGIGLLLTGVVLIGVSYGWWRLRGAIPVAKAAT